MESLKRSLEVADELKESLVRHRSSSSPRLLICVQEIIPLLKKLSSFHEPWNPSTVNALNQLLEAMKSTLVLIQTEPLPNRVSVADAGIMIATRSLWKRQIEMYLALQLQDVLERTCSPKQTTHSSLLASKGIPPNAGGKTQHAADSAASLF
eukprot:g3809.t1